MTIISAPDVLYEIARGRKAHKWLCDKAAIKAEHFPVEFSSTCPTFHREHKASNGVLIQSWGLDVVIQKPSDGDRMNAFILIILDFGRVTWMNSIFAEHWKCDQLCSNHWFVRVCVFSRLCVCHKVIFFFLFPARGPWWNWFRVTPGCQVITHLPAPQTHSILLYCPRCRRHILAIAISENKLFSGSVIQVSHRRLLQIV